MTAPVIALVAGWAVWRLAVHRPWPRRIPPVAGPRDGQGGGPPVRRHPLRPRRPGRPIPSRSSGRSRSTHRSPSPRRTDRWRGVAPRTHDLVACTELLAVAAGAGCSLHTAVALVGAGGRGPVAASLAGVAQDVDRGVPLEQALEHLTRDQPPEVLALGTALLVAAGSGTPAAPALQRLADAERRRTRRSVEAGIRRLPVLLLIPLVGCILPAFVVMTLVPVGLSAARSVDASPVPTPATEPEAHHG